MRNLRHNLFAESAMIFAFASSLSLYFCSSLTSSLTLLGCACIRMGRSSFGSALATAATVLKPLSQNTRLSHRQPLLRVRLLLSCGISYAVRLFTNVILERARRSDLAPAFNLSEKWSSAAAMALAAR